MSTDSKYDIEAARSKGILYKKQPKSHSQSHNKTVVEPHVLVSNDGGSWAHFNLYNGSLGKKKVEPVLQEITNPLIVDNIDAIHEYLTKRGYEKI